jgi:hypothetical protein
MLLVHRLKCFRIWTALNQLNLTKLSLGIKFFEKLQNQNPVPMRSATHFALIDFNHIYYDDEDSEV